ncbi:MAG: 6-carboxytetrahydropterin synthase [Pseudomonadota bacterium]
MTNGAPDDEARAMIEIFKEFTFEAAHQLGANVAPGHPYANLHGHSFHACVLLRGTPDPETGWLHDFAEVEAALEPIRKTLDHAYLNAIEELGLPTLENITRYIWNRAQADLPSLYSVTVRRGTCGEGCTYYGV